MRDLCDDGRLSALLDDELGELEALAVARHLDGCDHCRAEFEDLRRTRMALRSLPPVPALSPGIFGEAIAAAHSTEQRRRRHQLTALGAGGATVGVALSLWLAGAAGDGTVVPPMDRFVADHVGRVDHGPLVTPVDFGR